MNPTWPIRPLETLCERITVGHVGPMMDEYVDEGIPFLRSQNIHPFRIATDNMRYISAAFNERIRKSLLHPGDVAVVRTGYPGTAAVVPDWLPVANCADLVIITPGAALDPYFLTAVFNSTWGIALVGGRLVGSAQQHFNIGAAKRLELHLPPLQTQRKIAFILSTLGDLIDNNMRRILVLEEIVQRLYREWFVDFRFPGRGEAPLVSSDIGPIPSGWMVSRVGDLVDIVRGLSYRGADVIPSGGLPFITLKCIARDGGFRADGLKRYSGEYKRSQTVAPGDIVMAVTDMTPERRVVARAARVPGIDEEFGVFSMDLVKIVPRDCPSQYAFGALAYSTFPDEVKDHANGANVLHLAAERITDYQFARAPHALALDYAARVEPLWQLSDSLFRANARLGEAHKLLLSRLVSGQLDLSDFAVGIPEAVA